MADIEMIKCSTCWKVGNCTNAPEDPEDRELTFCTQWQEAEPKPRPAGPSDLWASGEDAPL